VCGGVACSCSSSSFSSSSSSSSSCFSVCCQRLFACQEPCRRPRAREKEEGHAVQVRMCLLVVVPSVGVWSVVMESWRAAKLYIVIITRQPFSARTECVSQRACPTPFRSYPTLCKRSGTFTPPCHLSRQAIDWLASPRSESETTAGRRSHFSTSERKEAGLFSRTQAQSPHSPHGPRLFTPRPRPTRSRMSRQEVRCHGLEGFCFLLRVRAALLVVVLRAISDWDAFFSLAVTQPASRG